MWLNKSRILNLLMKMISLFSFGLFMNVVEICGNSMKVMKVMIIRKMIINVR